MSEIFNIYCDESCHLENDGRNAMVLGLKSPIRIALFIFAVRRRFRLHG